MKEILIKQRKISQIKAVTWVVLTYDIFDMSRYYTSTGKMKKKCVGGFFHWPVN